MAPEDQTLQWFQRLYGNAPGLISLAQIPAKGNFRTAGVYENPEAAAAHVKALAAKNPKGIYHRVTTLAARPGPGERGGSVASLALPGLWADVDFGSAGHKHDPAKHDDRPLPPTAQDARQLVVESGLPAPSLWVHTGGGLYPWWLLARPLILDDSNLDQVQEVSTAWQQVIQRSAQHRLGFDYGAGVGDLARVLRVPGTDNNKTDTPRPCRIIEETGAVYDFTELVTALTKLPEPARRAPVERPPSPPRPRPAADPFHPGTSAFDTLDEHVTFDDLLTGAGWTQHRANHSPSIQTCWTRPGDPSSPCSAHTLTEQPNVLVVFSENAGLPTGGGRKLTRGRVFAHLHHQGNERAASLDLFAAINGRPSTAAAGALPLPRSSHMPDRPVTLGTIGDRDTELRDTGQSSADLASPPPEDPWADQAPPEHQDPQDDHERRVLDELSKLRVRREAQDRLREETAPPAEPFDAGTLGQILARPPEPAMRADGLIPWAASALLVAQRKAGKTTLTLNYARALLTGEDLLGRFPVRPLQGTVTLLNYEVSGATVARWADEHGIDHDRFHIVNLRGRRNPLSNERDRLALADQLRQWNTEALIVDPFGRAYTGQSQNDSGEVGSWLVALDRFAREESGATDLVLTAHAGWNGERTRGASALEDWADVIITLATRDEDDGTDTRWLRAIGRDVELEEDRLDYNARTRSLTLAGVGSRRKTQAEGKVAELAVFVARATRQREGLSTTAIENAIRAMEDAPTFRNGEVAKAAKYAAERGHIRLEAGGKGRPTHHYLPVTAPTTRGEVTSPDETAGQQPLPPLPNLSPGALHTTSPTSPYRGEVEVGEVQDPTTGRGPDTERNAS